MLVSMDKAYRTKCGYPVKIYAIYEDQEYETVHGAMFKNGKWISALWRKDGRFDTFLFLKENDNDLIEVKKTHTVTFWVNYYPDGGVRVWSSKQLADEVARETRIACLEFTRTFTEGEGLEGGE